MTTVKARFALPQGSQLCISQGNIVAFCGDAIVNAADHKCIYGKGVDGAINKAGGPALMAARRALPIVPGTTETRCPVGEARWTTAGNLPLKGVIHAVGPNFNPKAQWVQKVTPNGEEVLYQTYAASMRIAEEHKCESVAFSLLSAGFFRGPKPLHDLFGIAIRAIRDGAYAGLREAHLLAFGEPHAAEVHDARALSQAARSVGLQRTEGAPIRSSGGVSRLTAEQRARIEASRAAALARRHHPSAPASSSYSSVASCFAREAASTAASSAAASGAAPTAFGVSEENEKEVIEISDGDTEEDGIEEVQPAAKRAKAT